MGRVDDTHGLGAEGCVDGLGDGRRGGDGAGGGAWEVGVGDRGCERSGGADAIATRRVRGRGWKGFEEGGLLDWTVKGGGVRLEPLLNWQVQSRGSRLWLINLGRLWPLKRREGHVQPS